MNSSFHESRIQEQEFNIFDQIIQKLEKYVRPVNQDKYQDYCNGESYDIGKISALE
jgi:hypothetical protein